MLPFSSRSLRSCPGLLALAAAVTLVGSIGSVAHAQSFTAKSYDMFTFDDRGYTPLIVNQYLNGGPVSTDTSYRSGYFAGAFATGSGYSQAFNDAAQANAGGGVRGSRTYGWTDYTVQGNSDGFGRNIVAFRSYALSYSPSGSTANGDTWSAVSSGGTVLTLSNTANNIYVGAANNGATFTAFNSAADASAPGYNAVNPGYYSYAQSNADVGNASKVRLTGGNGGGAVTFTQASNTASFTSDLFALTRDQVSLYNFGTVNSLYLDTVRYETQYLVNGNVVGGNTSFLNWNAGQSGIQNVAALNDSFSLASLGLADGALVNVQLRRIATGYAYGTTNTDMRGTYNLFDVTTGTQTFQIVGSPAAVPEPGALVTGAVMFGTTGLGMVRARVRRKGMSAA